MPFPPPPAAEADMPYPPVWRKLPAIGAPMEGFFAWPGNDGRALDLASFLLIILEAIET